MNMRISGAFRLEHKTAFELDLSSDDGSILLIDGLRRLKMLGWHPSLHTARRLVLEPGWHSLELLYFQHQGGAQLKLAGLETLEPNLAPAFPSSGFWPHLAPKPQSAVDPQPLSAFGLVRRFFVPFAAHALPPGLGGKGRPMDMASQSLARGSAVLGGAAVFQAGPVSRHALRRGFDGRFGLFPALVRAD